MTLTMVIVMQFVNLKHNPRPRQIPYHSPMMRGSASGEAMMGEEGKKFANARNQVGGMVKR
jgi:hypothetical protein